MTAWRIILPLGAVIAILGLIILWQSAAGRADSLEVELQAARSEADGQRRRSDQLERAAIKRMADESAVDAMGKELNDAIKDIPASAAPGPATVALGCGRLRAAGATTSDAFKRICG